MANWAQILISQPYATLVGVIKDAMADVARMFDPATTNATNIPTGAIRWTTANKRWEKWDGADWVENSDLYAINVSGNASTATKLATARSISMTGDGTWSVSFDGAGNATAAMALANTGVTAGTYGDSTHVAQIAVDAKGRLTGVSAVAINLSWSGLSGKPTTVAGFGITDMGSQSVSYAATAGSAGAVAWGNVSGRPTDLGSFANGPGFITGSGSCSYASSAGSAGSVGGVSNPIPKDVGAVGVGAFFGICHYETPYAVGGVYAINGTSRCISTHSGTGYGTSIFQRIA